MRTNSKVQRLKAKGHKPEAEARRPRAEVRNPKPETRRQISEDGRRRAEDRGAAAVGYLASFLCACVVLALLVTGCVGHRELLAAIDRQATRINAVESGLARVDERTKDVTMQPTCRITKRGCPQPQQPGNCRTAAPASRGSLAFGPAAAEDSRALRTNNFGACHLAGTAGHARRFNNKTKKESK